jgi:26S proteasome regulatory subunit N7
MGSDPQYAKYPDLSLAQDIFTLTNPSSSLPSRQSAVKRLQDAISEHKMAPLYRHLAHPTEGILNGSGEGTSSRPPPNSRRVRPASQIAASSRSALSIPFPWDEQLYDKLVTENEEELETFNKEEGEAEEIAGDTEIQAAKGKKAEFWARVGDKVCMEISLIESSRLTTMKYLGQSAFLIRGSIREDWCTWYKNRYSPRYHKSWTVFQ